MIEKNDTWFCRHTETDILDTWIKVQKKVLLMLIMFSSIGEAVVKVK